jgi:hypothetical protein
MVDQQSCAAEACRVTEVVRRGGVGHTGSAGDHAQRESGCAPLADDIGCDGAQAATEESVAAAQFVAPQLGPLAPQYSAEVNEAFLSGLSVACMVAAAVALSGSIFAARFLPARAAQDAEAPEVDAVREVDLVAVSL